MLQLAKQPSSVMFQQATTLVEDHESAPSTTDAANRRHRQASRLFRPIGSPSPGTPTLPASGRSPVQLRRDASSSSPEMSGVPSNLGVRLLANRSRRPTARPGSARDVVYGSLPNPSRIPPRRGASGASRRWGLPSRTPLSKLSMPGPAPSWRDPRGYAGFLPDTSDEIGGTFHDW